MRRAARKDTNQSEIENALKKIGATYMDTSSVGRGFPDLVVGFRGRNYLIEVKDGEKCPSQRRLTKAQLKFHSYWQSDIFVIKDISELLSVLC